MGPRGGGLRPCLEEQVLGRAQGGLQGGGDSHAQRLRQALQEAPKEDLRHQEEAEVHSIPQEAVRGCVGSEMRQEAQKGMSKEDCAGMLACPIQGMRTCPSQEAKESLRS